MKPAFCRLPLCCDIERLKQDVARIAAPAWHVHFNTGYHSGGWTGVALRAVDGDADKLYPDPAATGAFRDTDQLSTCPSVREWLAQFQCPVHSARLLRLAAGGTIREHRDDGLGLDHEIRLHLPVCTNAEVEFYLDGVRVPMAEGECWYLDLSLPHRVQNNGSTDRIHLVIDCTVNDWLRGLFPSPAEIDAIQRDCRVIAANATSSARRLEEYRTLVRGDAGLQEMLRKHDGLESFVASVVASGREHRCDFSPEDVRAALAAARRAWIEPLIVR